MWMDTKAKSGASWLARVLLFLAGLALGGGLVAAHFGGLFTPLYHKLGLHSMHEDGEQAAGGSSAAGGHAGHGGMAMTPSSGGEPSSIPGYSIVKITPDRQQLIGVRTGRAVRDRLRMSIRAVGIMEPDQTRLFRIHPRVSGWITKVHVNFVGKEVKQGHTLVEIYSPDLLQTQLDYLLALDSWKSQGKTEDRKRLVDSTRRKLELYGIAAEDIEALDKTGKASDTLKLRSPVTGRVLDRNVQEGSYVEPNTDLYKIADLSVVWLQAKVYEFEMPHIEMDQAVQISVLSQPGAKIEGKVSFIEPVVQEMTRTVNVRVALENPKNEFKPGMYATLEFKHDMGEGLLIPESAVLRTGLRDLVFRVLPGNRFEPVSVKLGARFEDRYEVQEGLREGDEIVTSAGFLIDAESRLRAATAGMTGHQHGTSGGHDMSNMKDQEKKGPTTGKGHEHQHDH
jgi:Cu(I)/Ag(I) efflux system membrane fusion protein